MLKTPQSITVNVLVFGFHLHISKEIYLKTKALPTFHFNYLAQIIQEKLFYENYLSIINGTWSKITQFQYNKFLRN